MAQRKSKVVTSFWEQAFSPEEQERWEAIRALAALKQPDADRALMELYKCSPFLSERIEILEALTDHLTPRRLCFLFSLVQSSSLEVRSLLLKKLSSPTGAWLSERRAFLASEKKPSSSWMDAFLESGALIEHFDSFKAWLQSQPTLKDLWLQKSRPWLSASQQQTLQCLETPPIELALWGSKAPLKDWQELARREPWKALRLAAEMNLQGDALQDLLQQGRSTSSAEAINAVLYYLSFHPDASWHPFLETLPLSDWGTKVLKAWSGALTPDLINWAHCMLASQATPFQIQVEILMALRAGRKAPSFHPEWNPRLRHWSEKASLPLAPLNQTPHLEARLEASLQGLKTDDPVTTLFMAHRFLEQTFLTHWEPILTHVLKHHFHALRSRLYSLGLNQAFPSVALLKKFFPDSEAVPLTKIVQLSHSLAHPPVPRSALTGLRAWVALSYMCDPIEPQLKLTLKQKKQLMQLQEERNAVVHSFKEPSHEEARQYVSKVAGLLKHFSPTH
jgi:hypothetical protein